MARSVQAPTVWTPWRAWSAIGVIGRLRSQQEVERASDGGVQSTGTVYAAGHNLASHEGYVTASTIKAKSFGPIYPIDSPTYPSEGFSSSNIVAAHGVLAEAYASSQAPGHRLIAGPR